MKNTRIEEENVKERAMAFIATLIAICLLCCVAVGETDLISRIRNADVIQWASENYVILDGEMIRVNDGSVLFKNVYNAASTGSYIWIETADGIWIIEKNGNSRSLETVSAIYVYGKCGVFYGWLKNGLEDDRCRSFVYDPATGSLIILSESEICDVYQDMEGQVYILTENCGIYTANGTQILEEGNYSRAVNCNYSSITNNHLTVYDQTDSAVILSPFTGEVEASFPSLTWVNYDRNHDIYRDNTALIGPEGNQGFGTMVIGLDGVVLKELPDGYSFTSRGEGQPLYGLGIGNDLICYNVITDRTYLRDDYDYPEYITCNETGEIFKASRDENEKIIEYHSLKNRNAYSENDIYVSGDPIPERYEKYRPVQERMYWPEYSDESMKVTAPDGTVIWSQNYGYFPWGDKRTGAMMGYHLFEEVPICAVADENNLYSVFNMEGDIVLPAEYEQIDLIDSFSDDSTKNGHCLAAKKDGQWYVFNEKGDTLY